MFSLNPNLLQLIWMFALSRDIRHSGVLRTEYPNILRLAGQCIAAWYSGSISRPRSERQKKSRANVEGSRSTLLCIRSAPLRAFDLSPFLICSRTGGARESLGQTQRRRRYHVPPLPVHGAAGLPPDHPIPARSLVVCLSAAPLISVFSLCRIRRCSGG
jgi:hypothetical protein